MEILGKIIFKNSKLGVNITTEQGELIFPVHPESLFINLGDEKIHILKNETYNHWFGTTGKVIQINKNIFLLEFNRNWKESFSKNQIFKYGPGEIVKGEIVEDHQQIRYTNGEWSRSAQIIKYFKINNRIEEWKI